MTSKVLPVTKYDLTPKKSIILKEDEDQGEMDTVFFLSLISYSVFVACRDSFYTDESKMAEASFNLVMSNLFAFFPIMQAQGLWLKSLLILTVYFSIRWHWTNIGLKLTSDDQWYGKWDAVFSIMIIVAYCMSYLPKCKRDFQPTEEQEKKSWVYRMCLGRPKETSEWRCRWSYTLLINMILTTGVGVMVYHVWHGGSMNIQIAICWVAICIAVVSAVYQLAMGELKAGNAKTRKKFMFWIVCGTVFGITAFLFKTAEGNTKADDFFFHSLWHAYVMSCAYSFSRATEYKEIYI